jgi:uncharacterized membrane protein
MATVTVAFAIALFGALLWSMPIGERTSDRNLKLGFFYVNRDDPALWVKKRFGIGYTLNFGHPASWFIVLIPIAVVFAVSLEIQPR